MRLVRMQLLTWLCQGNSLLLTKLILVQLNLRTIVFFRRYHYSKTLTFTSGFPFVPLFPAPPFIPLIMFIFTCFLYASLSDIVSFRCDNKPPVLFSSVGYTRGSKLRRCLRRFRKSTAFTR